MPSFKMPGEPPKDRLGDYVDQLILIRPKEYGPLETRLFGIATVLFCDVLVPLPEKGSGHYFNLGDKVPVFWKGVQAQLDETGPGEWTAGRIRQGTATNAQAYWLQPPTEEDVPVLEAVLASLEDF